MPIKLDYTEIVDKYLSLTEHKGLVKDSKAIGTSYNTLIKALKSVGEIPLLAKVGRKRKSEPRPQKLTFQSYSELQIALADKIKLRYQLPS